MNDENFSILRTKAIAAFISSVLIMLLINFFNPAWNAFFKILAFVSLLLLVLFTFLMVIGILGVTLDNYYENKHMEDGK